MQYDELVKENARLQAEVAQWKQGAQVEADAADEARAELIKVRELLEEPFQLVFEGYNRPGTDFATDAAWAIWQHAQLTKAFALLRKVCRPANQSAPAGKGQGEPVEKLQTRAQPVKWWNGCDSEVPRALRFLANNERPHGGEQRFNAAHLFQLAGEIERMARTPLYAEQPAPVAVVMPDFDTWYVKNRGVIGTAIYKNERKVWSACLDELARLNSVPKP